MGERIDQFCENLRVKLTGVDNKMQALKQTIDSRQQTAEQDVRTHLDAVKKRMEQDRSKVTTAQADQKSGSKSASRPPGKKSPSGRPRARN